MITKKFFAISGVLLTALQVCPTPLKAAGLTGEVKLDGSSTVFPLGEAVAEEFGHKEPKVRVTVGSSGTGGGFKKFATGEIDICQASRPINPNELAAANKHGIEVIELPVAQDGVAVVVHPSNTFARLLTFAQLKKIWQPDSPAKLWSDVDPSWPKEKIKLFGPGTDSGTFDYFTEEVVGKARSSRSDYTASEDDNVLVRGVTGEKFALGYFGYSYLLAAPGKLRAVPVDKGKGPVAVSEETIGNHSYPLSRLLYIYVSSKAIVRPEVDALVKFYLDNTKSLAKQVGYLPIADTLSAETQKRLKERQVGPTKAAVR